MRNDNGSRRNLRDFGTLQSGRATKGAAFAALLTVAACTQPLPTGAAEDDLAAFEQAVATINCQLVKGSHYNTVQFQTGMTREQVSGMASYALGAGRAEKLESGGIRLTAGPCAKGNPAVGTRISLRPGV
jgi:hypothetical protein